jgi:hypothetical protein
MDASARKGFGAAEQLRAQLEFENLPSFEPDNIKSSI